MKRKIFILMHTHWDREWYFTKDETKVFLLNHMKEVINFLEKNKECIYILDGQSVMIEDFLEFAPNWENRLETLIKNKQLRVGPWYTQTDLLIVHGESIIRNLYYGIKDTEKYGETMKVGYAPDTFGHSAQMPQIYKQFGIESSFFWRGFSELKSDKSDFIWEGIDGSKIYGINLSTGYQGAKYLENTKVELEDRMKKIMGVLDKYSIGEARLIMNGHDQMPIQKDIYEIIEKLKEIYFEDEIKINDFESYVEEIKKYDMDTVKGELIHSKHARIHKTINSTRMDIKLLNNEIEHKLYNILEPLSVLGTYLNIEYPHKLFEKNYKKIFEAHAHDSIGGCNSDKVNSDIKQRLLSVKEVVDTQIELYMRLITLSGNSNKNFVENSKHKLENIDYEIKEDTITIYNFLPYKRVNEYVEVEMITRNSSFNILDENKRSIDYILLDQNITDAGLIDRQVAARLLDIKVYKSKIRFKVEEIQGLSVKYFSYIEEKEQVNEGKVVDKLDNINKIENEYYKIEISEKSVNLYNKNSNEKIEKFIFIENSGDAGDSYDYSPPLKDFFIRECQNIKNIKTIKSKNTEHISFEWEYILPLNIKEREEEICTQEVTFKVNISLNSNDEVININICHKNSLYDSRYRIGVKTKILTNTVISDSHLCTVIKPVYFEEELAIWEKEKWVEKPVSIETFQSYVSLENENKTKKVTLISDGLKEYEVLDDNIYITLFRSFSHLGKRELLNRPGRPSGIEIETPDNQLINQKFEFSFGLDFSNEIKNSSELSKKFLTPLKGYQLKEFNRFNINSPSLFKKIDGFTNLELKGCVVSACKMTENNELFIRVFNPDNIEKTLEFKEEVYLSSPMEIKSKKITSYNIKNQELLNLIIK